MCDRSFTEVLLVLSIQVSLSELVPSIYFQDVLQSMLEAQQTPDGQGRILTDDEIIVQSVIFMAAGYETSSTTLALVSYYLALCPEIQDRLHDEIVRCWPENDMPDYDTVHKMVYLDQVISETLRMCPPGKTLRNNFSYYMLNF